MIRLPYGRSGARWAVLVEYLEEQKISASDYKINRSIRAREVRLIGPDGKNVGVVSIEEALKVAESSGLTR